MKFGFGSRVKPRKFDYLPRFYDEQKEELENRLKKFEGNESDQVKDRIRSGLRQRYLNDPEYRSKTVKKSNFRLIYVILILILITYLIMRSNSFLRFVESFN